jgi:DNA-binding MarR family transcriptional regulator
MRERDSVIRAMNSLRRLVSALRTSGAGAFPGLSVAQQFALRTIGRTPGLSMSDLARATATTPSTVSEVVVRLVDHGLVSRAKDDTDHRRVRLTLTAIGTKTFERLEQTLPERLVCALEQMNPFTRDALADALDAWVDSAGLSNEFPQMFGEPRPNAPLRGPRRALGDAQVKR